VTLPSGNGATVQPLPDDLPDDLLDELDAFLMQASHDDIDPETRRISNRPQPNRRCQLHKPPDVRVGAEVSSSAARSRSSGAERARRHRQHRR
jgi:hypothetical protein